MSAYQYYEFLAVDRPLTAEEMSELRSFSSRAEITVSRFSNTYHWGNFKGSPERMMERYFDAHVYVSNWGVFNFLLRFPRGVIHEPTIEEYSAEGGLTYWATEEHLIISLHRYEEEGGEWVDGEGWMARLLPIREELERGDYRSLYIGWLAAARLSLIDDEEDGSVYEDVDSITEPPVPQGLCALTAAQQALVEFLDIGTDMIKAAALASPALSEDKESDRLMTEWVALVSEKEARDYLLMVLKGESRKAERQIRSRYHEFVRLRTPFEEKDVLARRTIRELRALVRDVGKERKRQEALKQERERAERERKRRAYLSEMALDFAGWWKKADAHAQEQSASAYDRARNIIVDMRDAYAQEGREQEFAERLRQFTSKHARRQALMRRLKDAGIEVLK